MKPSPAFPKEHFAPLSEQRTVADYVLDFCTRYEVALLIGVLGAFLVAAAFCSRIKPLWFDEVFTGIVVTQPTLHRFMQAMPAEGNPPLYTAMTSLFVHLFGLSAFTLRLGSMLGFTGALVGLYVFVRRECGPIWGLVAVLAVTAQPIVNYAFEARPYGLMLGLVMLGVVSWQSAARSKDMDPSRPRTLALLGMCIGIAGSALCHDIGLVEVGLPLLFGEAVRAYRRRRIDWPLMATGLVAIPAMAIVLPSMLATGQAVVAHSPFLTPPITLHKLVAYFGWAKGSVGLVMKYLITEVTLAAALLAWAPGRGGRGAEESSSAPALAVALGAFLLIPFIFLLLIPAHGWFFCRYGIASVFGLAMLLCLLAGRQPRFRVVGALLLLIFGLASPANFRSVCIDLKPSTVNNEFFYENTSGLPVVVAYPFDYPTVWWYASPAMKRQMVYLLNAPEKDSLLDGCIRAEHPVIDANIQDHDAFVRSQQHFLMVDRGGELEMKSRLEMEGFQVTQIRADVDDVMYDVVRKQ